MFSLMREITLRPSSMAATTSSRLSFINTISPLSMATSVPLPMAMPTSAWARAGASLMPSPTKATLLPLCCSLLISLDLSSGKTSERTVFMPSSPATAAALFALSPVIITTDKFILCRSDTAFWADSFSRSEMAKTAQARPSRAMSMAVFPCSS